MGVIDTRDVLSMMNRACEMVIERKDALSALDAACGDGDHGVSMARGFAAVAEKLRAAPFVDPSDVFRAAGSALLLSVGGATGPLLGTFFMEAGKAARAAGAAGIDTGTLAAMFRAGAEALCRRGGAKVGEKTLVDALMPAVEAIEASAAAGESPATALDKAAKAARSGATGTASMIARQGKARYLGQRAVGSQDPGANSVAIILEAFAEALA